MWWTQRHRDRFYLSTGCPTRYRTGWLAGGPLLRVATIRRTTDTHYRHSSFSFLTQRTYSCSNFVALSSFILELLKKCRVWERVGYPIVFCISTSVKTQVLHTESSFSQRIDIGTNRSQSHKDCFTLPQEGMKCHSTRAVVESWKWFSFMVHTHDCCHGAS